MYNVQDLIKKLLSTQRNRIDDGKPREKQIEPDTDDSDDTDTGKQARTFKY